MKGGNGVGEDGKAVPKGMIMTVLGKEEVVEHEVDELTKQIVVMGEFLRSTLGAKEGARVAVYLPNSIEYLLAIFGKLITYPSVSRRNRLINIQPAPSTTSPPSSSPTTSPPPNSTTSSTRPPPKPLSAPRAARPSTTSPSTAQNSNS